MDSPHSPAGKCSLCSSGTPGRGNHPPLGTGPFQPEHSVGTPCRALRTAHVQEGIFLHPFLHHIQFSRPAGGSGEVSCSRSGGREEGCFSPDKRALVPPRGTGGSRDGSADVAAGRVGSGAAPG